MAKQKTQWMSLVWVGLGLLVLGVMTGYVNIGQSDVAGTDTITEVIKSTQACGDDQTATWQYAYKNKLNDATAEYLSATGYLFLNGDLVDTSTIANNSAQTLSCQAGDYTFVTKSSNTIGARTVQIKGSELSDGMAIVKIDGAEQDSIKARMFDNLNNVYLYDDSDNTQDYQNANATFNGTTSGSYDWSDNNYVADLRIDLRAQNADREFGDNQAVACIFFNGDQMKDPEVTNNGRSLTSADEYLASADPSYSKILSQNPVSTSGAEVCYKIDNILGDETSEIGIYLERESGQTPSEDVYVYLFAQGSYLSSGNEIGYGVYTDASTKTWAGHYEQVVRLDCKA